MKQKIYTIPLFQNIVFLWLLFHIASNILLASFRFINSYLFFANPNYLNLTEDNPAISLLSIRYDANEYLNHPILLFLEYLSNQVPQWIFFGLSLFIAQYCYKKFNKKSFQVLLIILFALIHALLYKWFGTEYRNIFTSEVLPNYNPILNITYRVWEIIPLTTSFAFFNLLVILSFHEKIKIVSLNIFNTNKINSKVNLDKKNHIDLVESSPNEANKQNQQTEYLECKKLNKTFFINLVDISHIEYSSNYLSVFSQGDEFLIRSSMKQIEVSLPPNFIKIKRNLIINKNFIEKTSRFYRGKNKIIEIFLKQNLSFEVSRNYHEIIEKQKLTESLLK
ncbi:hypothetical protein CF386_09255 [Paraphotobacterium marinum]|uniref:HTH LytTR-type domain-containing protein n=1 Tax=Paraphotobacterium marinum TaxID=1755811 RepID=A0A220VFQ5_9GAMM|nr:LytTR family DNA-binding domain-containing protein [Paraphotobacterium marinum]ASK79248.1 hypothetical protein CF386_09255 [Paraphotobacterium marinum]